MMRFSFLLILVLWSCNSAKTVFEVVELPRPEKPKDAYAQIEPSIAIHPRNQNEMIAGTVMDDYYYSSDGGKTWESEVLTSPYGVSGDPVVHIDNTGRFYYVHLSDPVESHRLDRIICQYSDTISGDWTSSYTEPSGKKVQDKPWIAECPKTGNMYLTWTQFDAYKSADPQDSSVIMFSKSTDRGEHWSAPKRISKLAGDCLDGNETVEGAVPAVGLDGSVYVAWTGPHGIRFNRSYDYGETWLEEELKVSDHPGGWSFKIPGIYRANGLPITKVDQSEGPCKGRIYVNWADQRYGRHNTDIFMAYSDDRGKTWSDAIRVNQDETEHQQFFTWMDIDQSTGYLYFIYYDRRNHDDNQTDVYLAYSRDGGQTIIEHKISEKPFLPDGEIFFGDYLNIAAVKGIIRPIWPSMHNQNIRLHVALVDAIKLK